MGEIRTVARRKVVARAARKIWAVGLKTKNIESYLRVSFRLRYMLYVGVFTEITMMGMLDGGEAGVIRARAVIY
jgi:hypothetical protein